jgi:hypothetical protein
MGNGYAKCSGKLRRCQSPQSLVRPIEMIFLKPVVGQGL